MKNYKKLFLLGFGFFGISILWPLYNAYVPIFLKDFSLSSTSIGFVMTIDNIFAIFMLPLIGVLSDQTRSRFGRRMPYILIGAPLGALFFSLIPFARTLHLLWFFMLNIIFMNFFMALFRSPVIALMPDITPPKYRSQANGIINFMGGLGALLAYFAGKPLYDKNYALPFWLGAIIMLVASLLVVIFIKEDEKYKIRTGEKVKFSSVFSKSFGELKINLKEVFFSKEKSLLMILIAILFWFVGYNALETFFTSYAKFRVGISESTGAFILGFFSLTFMLFSIPAGIIGSKIGRKKTMTIGLMIVALISLLTVISTYIFKDTGTITRLLFIYFTLGGIGWAMVNVNSLPTVVDMTSEEKLGGYTGLYYFFSMSANIIAPPLSGFFIDKLGYDSLIYFSTVSFVIATIFLQYVRRGDVK
ncbi:sucrose transporter [Thermosipho melanesiensis]|uniref:Major facilitator superfamily MFS_1 n=2 Tax=Thermosipho melanesiensis TaxID=46541 RepID=A6LKD9_THEM4|nr:SLC45 family MFS transporter [Thermosipho melanesiensis]ABR30390.1 major facilitator superfamily MFS_1 [Thermosipho melanesiensis BI429]APT73552.1 sucrose transporter [Thermosipho melanesiensis]OOC37503.1 sucrose transporter [Thermosipho melanesiensis]OOC39542.1 sucrose transporter [Thermosipho melanesiensis]OOC39559.1 sucrose transporter [Thermosipho melanesiensis]